MSFLPSPLASDYINHFAELVMLLDMFAEQPDVAGDILSWRPRGYVEHLARMGAGGAAFRQSYGSVDVVLRARLDRVVADANALGLAIQSCLREGAADAPARIEADRVALHGRLRELSILLRGETPRALDARDRQLEIDALTAGP